jgi:SAM-dependent methyltransferase
MHWDLACPTCRVALTSVHTDEQLCPRCNVTYRREDGIWRLLAEGREEAFREFVQRYETVRRGEGRTMRDSDQLRALPFHDRSRKHRYEWNIRSRSYKALIQHVIQPIERASSRQLRIADLGSGLGWLAYRLALRGHEVAAVDLVTNDFDGLGVQRHYGGAFVSLQAEFDRLPFLDQHVDLIAYNAAFHYAVDYLGTLREALRVLAPLGRMVILDSPIYRDAASGGAMVKEREDTFEREYGLRANAIRTEGFLTYDRLVKLGEELSLRWELFAPWYGMRWWLKRRLARLRGWREPAQFRLIVGHRLGDP